MELERKCLRVGLTAILCAAVLRLLGGGFFQPAVAFLTKPETASFLLYLQTGRVVRLAPAAVPAPTAEQTEPVQETQPAQTLPQRQPISFRAEDAELLKVSYHCGYEPDLAALLTEDLELDLRAEGPTVLILHTHATESYTKSPGEQYTESSAYRTLDENYNMVSIGEHVARILEESGVEVIHARVLHDHPSYTGAYDSARSTISAYLERYPSIQLVLDLHRDALSLDSTSQLDTSATVDGQPSAQVMMVVGTDAGGLNHPNWQENMALAVKLHALLEKQWPGLCRAISFRSQRFNQDLSPGAMLIEIGAAGDSHREALTAAEAVAKGILALADGATGYATS